MIIYLYTCISNDQIKLNQSHLAAQRAASYIIECMLGMHVSVNIGSAETLDECFNAIDQLATCILLKKTNHEVAKCGHIDRTSL